MSWIIGLHDSRQTICFSNQYAAKVIETSDRTIRTKINSLVEKGFIKTHITPTRRFIQVINIPTLENISVDVCDLEEPTQTEGGNNFHPPQENISIGEEIVSTGEEIVSRGEEITSTYKIDYKIEDKIVVSECEHTHPLYPTPFLELVEKYKDKNDKMDYTYQRWTELNPTERQVAFDSVDLYFVYLSRSGKVKKHLQYYLQDKVFNWDGLDKMKQTKNKPTPKKMTDAEKAAMGLELIKQHIQK
jgi:hypothetical protein